ncbi:MAG TPA: Ig-like domain-containing protein, partial [Flavobacteriales bacterium]|nr:Ig-like domain-containing protein [Flavobacteriales bacterium]
MSPRLAHPLLAVLAVLSFPAVHAQFTDDFADGDFTANPAWDGNTAVFLVNASQELQLNDAVAATSQLRSANAMATLDDSEWRMRVSLTFAPSSGNFARVYLVSDQTDLTSALNGYYLQFGEAGSLDAIELYEQTGVASALVCRGTDAQIAASFNVGVQVKRDAAGNWQLLVDPAGGTNYALQASGVSTLHTTSTTIGVLCTYTVSNADNFFFDDLYAGPQVVDTDPPTVLSASAIGAADVDVRFSEAVEEASAETVGNYGLAPSLGIASATRDGVDLALVHLSLATAMTNGTEYTVTATNVQDLAGNVGVASSATFTYLVPEVALPGEVVINELMPDPTPVVGLPDQEFIEIYNATTTKNFDLVN